MHIQNLVLLAAVISAPFSVLAADSVLSRELEDLQKQRIRALADAAEPINRKYQASLEQLLRRATQASDLETAIKVKEAIAANVPSPIPTGFEGNWTVRAYGSDRPRKLLPDHKVITENGPEGTWKVTGSKLIITFPSGSDVFYLPIQDDKLIGKNTPGAPLVMTRVK